MMELKAFEEDMADLIKNVEFKYANNALQEKMRRDIETIKNNPDVVVQADKTANIYLMPKDEYNHHLKNSITDEYKKVNVCIPTF